MIVYDNFNHLERKEMTTREEEIRSLERIEAGEPTLYLKFR